MLYSFVVLGQIPGTNIYLTFWQIMAMIGLGVAVTWLNHAYPGKLRAIAGYINHQKLAHPFRANQLRLKLTARRG